MNIAKSIRKIAVLGAGTMGYGIALTYAVYGYEVILNDCVPESLEKAKKNIALALQLFVSEDYFSEETVKAATERITYEKELSRAVDGVDIVVEVIIEDKNLKKNLYERLDQMLPETTIIASNTSSINIFELLPERRKGYGVIAHWFAPAHILPLIELCGCSETRPEVLDTVEELERSCDKTVVRVKRYHPTLIVNSLQTEIFASALRLVDEGYCTPEELDLAVKASIMPRAAMLGIFQARDFNGLEIGAELQTSPTLLGLVDAGNCGVKTGKGFYDYEGRAIPDVFSERDVGLLRITKALRDYTNKPL